MTSPFFACCWIVFTVISRHIFSTRLCRAGLVFSLSTNFALADPIEIFTEVFSESYSDISPIEQLIHDLDGPPVDRGEFAFTHNQFEIGQAQGDWSLSYFVRYDYYMKFNGDTAELAYLLRNDLPLPQNRLFDVDLKANHLVSQGLGLAKTFTHSPALSSRWRVNYFHASKTTNGYLKGQVQTLEDAYQAQLRLDYSYSRDTLLDRPEEDNYGQGLGLDFDLFWQASDKLSVSLQGRDALSWIRFEDQSFTAANADTDTVSFDENGTIDSRPTVSGVEGYRNDTQRLPARFTLSTLFTPANQKLGMGAEIFSIDRHVFSRISVQESWNGLTGKLSYDFRSNGVFFKLSGARFSVMLGGDSLDWEKARHLSVSLAYSVIF